jgi:hypothetical protein
MLTIIGGGTVLAAGTGATGFLATRQPARALAPWNRAGGYDEPRMRALSYAILAPNPHNRQPWLVDLRQPAMVVLYRDKTRDLPHTDPHARQLTIGLGCFLELMTMAAAEAGHAIELNLFPEGEDGPVAQARFRQADVARDPLFAQVMARRSCKEPFRDEPVPPGVAAQLAAHADVLVEPDRVAAIRALTWEAWQVEMRTPRTLKESVDLMRIGKAEIEANPDGIDLGGPFLETLALAGVLTRQAQLDPHSTAYREGVQMYREMLAATPAYAVVATPGNGRAEQIEAGRRWLRLNLAATGLGLALHPVSQALQEYPEMAAHYRRAHAILAAPGQTVQMLGRLGYGPAVARSPRWPLETRIIDA